MWVRIDSDCFLMNFSLIYISYHYLPCFKSEFGFPLICIFSIHGTNSCLYSYSVYLGFSRFSLHPTSPLGNFKCQWRWKCVWLRFLAEENSGHLMNEDFLQLFFFSCGMSPTLVSSKIIYLSWLISTSWEITSEPLKYAAAKDVFACLRHWTMLYHFDRIVYPNDVI